MHTSQSGGACQLISLVIVVSLVVVGRGKGGAGSGHCLVDEGFYQSALSLSAHTLMRHDLLQDRGARCSATYLL